MPEQQVDAQERADVAAPVAAEPGFQSPSVASWGTRSHEHATLGLQRAAGNRAVTRRLTGVQRAPGDARTGAPYAPKSIFDEYKDMPDPLTASVMSRPAPTPAPPHPPVEPPRAAHGRKRDDLTALTGGTDLGSAPVGDKPTKDMTYTETLDEIAAVEGWLSKRQQSSKETVAVEDRLHALYDRIATLLTARKGGRKRPTGPVPKPRSLTEQLDVLRLTRDQMASELDAIVEYLRGSPKRGEARKLVDVATYLEQKLGQQREAQSESVRQTDVGLALNVNYANVLSELEEVIHRIEQIRPDPRNPGLAYLPRGRASIPVLTAEVDALRLSAKRQVADYIGAVEELRDNAHVAYKARVEKQDAHPRVDYLVRVYTGVENLDPNEMAVEYSTLMSDAQAARRELSRGRLLRGMRRANRFGARTDGYAEKIAAWDSSLVRGAGRWVLALTVLKEGLTLVASGGATALTAFKVARGASLLRTTLTLGGTLGTTGFAAGFSGSLYSQSTSGRPISGWKAARMGRSVGIDSALIGLSPGVGTGARNVAGLGETAVGLSRTSRYVRTGLAELGSGTLLQGGAALAKGESVRDAVTGVAINAGISGIGGAALKDISGGSKVVETAGAGLLGGGANLATGLAQGKEGGDLAISTASGVAGATLSPHLESTSKRYLETRSPGAPTPGSGGAGNSGAPGGAGSESTAGSAPTSTAADATTAPAGGSESPPIAETAKGTGSGPKGRAAVEDGGVPDVSTLKGTGIEAKEPAQPSAPVAGTEQGHAPGPGAPMGAGTEQGYAAGPGGTGDESALPGKAATQAPPPDIANADTAAVKGPATAPSSAIGNEDTARPPDVAHADTDAAPPGLAVADTAEVPGAPSGLHVGGPRANPLKPGSKVPANLTKSPNPAIDIAAYERWRAGESTGTDLPSDPVRSAIPGVGYTPDEPGRYQSTGEKPVAGVSASKSRVVQDTQDNNKKYLFKPQSSEKTIDRAHERGVRKNQQGPREVAAPMVAGELDVDAARGRLVTIDGEPGVLIEWKDKNSLADLAINEPGEFKRLIASEEFREAMMSVDALDYLINNLDRGFNFGNYLYEFGHDGKLKLTVIDHGLTFTATKERADVYAYTRALPEKYTPDLARNLEKLAANRASFVEKIRPYVGDAAVAGFSHRLDVMLADMRTKQTPASP